MSRFTNNRIAFPTPYKLIQLPGITLPERLPNVPSASSSAVDGHSAGSIYNHPDDILYRDTSDFLTGNIDLALQRAHIINASRKDPPLASRIVSLHSRN